MQWLRAKVADHRFRRWIRSHRGGSFADFYAHMVERKIREGKPHKTLGARAWEAGHGPAVELDRSSFANRGKENWAQILDFGVTPQMRCVDYGCGSLRLGQHAMRYLDAGNYWGVDVTNAFIAEGLKLIDPALIEQRKPRFDTINDETLGRIRSWQPDFIFANAVLVHVPPEELELFFRRLDAIMAPGSKAVIIYIAGDRTRRVKSMNWVHTDEALERAVRKASGTLVVTFEEVLHEPRHVDGRPRRALILQRGMNTTDNDQTAS